MAEKLTPQQEMAVKNRGGNLLVSAAAGSGKTKVLVDRLMDYVMNPVDPANLDDFLIITYTKAAATELRGKISSKLSEKMAQFPDNKHLVSLNHETDTMTFFSVDLERGLLVMNGKEIKVEKPNCIIFHKL